MYCNKCGAKVNENDTVCSYCGGSVNQKSNIINQNQIYNSDNNNGNNNGYYQQNVQVPKKNKKTPYWLLPVSLFFGSFLSLLLATIIKIVMEANEVNNSFLQFLNHFFIAIYVIATIAVIPSIIVAVVLSNKESKNNSINNFNSDNFQNLDEKLIAAYIGSNYEKITTKKFNFAAWFFNVFYILYRKMYIQGILLVLGVNLLVSFLGDKISSILIFILLIVIGFIFNKVYVNYVKKQVELIKSNNPNSSEDELINICKNKGGTSLIISIVISIVLSSISSFLFQYINANINVKSGELGDASNGYVLEYKIPSSFNEDKYYSNGDRKRYSYDDACKVTIEYYKQDIYDFPIDYLKSATGKDESDIKYKEINSNAWYFANSELLTYETEYYYVHSDGNKWYRITFENDSDNDELCFEKYSKILNSLKFVEK